MRQRFTKQEKKTHHQNKIINNMTGTGIYIYENNTDGDLNLPKPTVSGSRTIGPRKRFQGDSYYMKWVGHPMNLLKFIEEIVPKDKKENNNMNENKLVLDQPDTITVQGKVEQVVVNESPTEQFNDSTGDLSATKPDVLLNESPIDGVEIIKG